MTEQFYDILTGLLSQGQMSISSIARELKKRGYDQHRLIITGYLRAMHDMGYLEEVDIPPSKVYTLKANHKRDIYSILKELLRDIDISERMDLAVYVITSLFHRPCFKRELELLGIEPRKTEHVRESKDPRLKEHIASVTRIKIPPEDTAFEFNEDSSDIEAKSITFLINVIYELIDLDGLKAKFQQKKLA